MAHKLTPSTQHPTRDMRGATRDTAHTANTRRALDGAVLLRYQQALISLAVFPAIWRQV